MTTKSYKVYAGMSFSYKITKSKYFDYEVSKAIEENTTDNITLEENPGLNISFDSLSSPKLVTISEGLLPNKSTFAGTVGYFGQYPNIFLYDNQIYKGLIKDKDSLVPNLNAQYNYDTGEMLLGFTPIEGFVWAGATLNRSSLQTDGKCNFEVEGTPTFSEHIVSGLDANNYLHTSFITPDDGQIEITAKIIINTSYNWQVCFMNTATVTQLIKTFKGTVGLFTLNSNDMGSFAVTNGDVVWVKVVITSENCIQYVIKDDGYTLDTLPDISSWTKNVETTDKVINTGENGYAIGINADTNYSVQHWYGSIDLDNFVIKNGSGEVIWKPIGEL